MTPLSSDVTHQRWSSCEFHSLRITRSPRTPVVPATSLTLRMWCLLCHSPHVGTQNAPPRSLVVPADKADALAAAMTARDHASYMKVARGLRGHGFRAYGSLVVNPARPTLPLP